MKWSIRVTKSAEKQIKKIPRNDALRIFASLDEMEGSPFIGDIVKLEGESNVWRRRIGNYRIVYRLLVDERIVDIYDVSRRTSSTY